MPINAPEEPTPAVKGNNDDVVAVVVSIIIVTYSLPTSAGRHKQESILP